MGHALLLRFTGYFLSIILTLAAYFIIIEPAFFHLETGTASIVIFVLALVQAAVQLIFFIHIWKEEGPLWNLHVFISTVLVIFIVIFFSIWIMNHLNYNMQYSS